MLIFARLKEAKGGAATFGTGLGTGQKLIFTACDKAI